MSKSNTFENDYLKLIFNNVGIGTIGDATGLPPSASAGNFYFTLHTADPGEAGNQSTSEAAYSGYARVAVPRTTGGFVVAGNTVTPANNIAFGTCTANPGNPITHFGIGTSASGVGKLLYSGAFSSPAALAVNMTPTIDVSSNIVVED